MHALPYAVRLFAALVTLAGAPGRTPSPDEQRLFEEGTRAFSSGDAQTAEKAWQAGYALGHDPAFLVHIGEAQEKAGAAAQAAASYRRYLQQVPDASDRVDIEQRLARLAPAAPPPAEPSAPAESPGEFGAGATSTGPPGAAATRAAPAAPAPTAPGAAPAPGASPRADEELPQSQVQASSGWNRYNMTALVATAVTVVLLGTAGFFAASAGSDRDDINRLVQFHDPATGAPLAYSSVAAEYTHAMDEGRRDDHDAKVALVGATVTAAVAALFFVFDATLTHQPSVSLAPAGDGGLAAVGGWTWRW
jgi:hypothetical protein